MICRMNRRQRTALIELIGAMIEEKLNVGTEEALRRIQLEEDFHNCFENETEDNYDHVKGA